MDTYARTLFCADGLGYFSRRLRGLWNGVDGSIWRTYLGCNPVPVALASYVPCPLPVLVPVSLSSALDLVTHFRTSDVLSQTYQWQLTFARVPVSLLGLAWGRHQHWPQFVVPLSKVARGKWHLWRVITAVQRESIRPIVGGLSFT